MSTLDLILAGGLALGVWRGMRTGALSQVVGTVGWLLGFLVASAVMRPVGALAASALGVSPRTGPVLGFILAFGLVLGGLMAAAHAMRKTLQAVKLGGLDTAGGAVTGGVRAAFGLSVMLLVTGFSPIPGRGPLLIAEETREDSLLHDPIHAVAPVVWDVGRAVVPGIQEAVDDRFNTWEETEAEAADDDFGDAEPDAESEL